MTIQYASDLHLEYEGKRFNTSLYNECHKQCMDFLTIELEKPFEGKTIIVSHHAPYPPEYCNYDFGPQLKEGFHVDLTWMVHKYNINHWISGYTHHNLESFQIGESWFHTNQLGYTFRDKPWIDQGNRPV